MSELHGHQSRDDHHGHGGGHRHGHGHDHGGLEPDWAALAPFLVRKAELYADFYRDAAAWIAARRPDTPVRRVLDIGSGPGVVTCLLAEAFPDAEVVAVDGNRPLLDHALARAESLGLGGRVRAVEGELPDAIADLGQADLVWAGDALHHVGDQRAALAAFAGLLRPGGTVALVEGGLPARHLPRDIGLGRPGIQSRIDVVMDGWFNRMRAELPGTKDEVEDWAALLGAVGLASTASRSFLLDFPAPLAPEVREQVVAGFTWQVQEVGEELEPDDREVLRRLLDPEDEAGLARRPDVFLLAAKSIHTGRRAG
ncbi:trans-aconitate 2-methyltransferase [Streptomyces sp. NPDC059070]|uniref:class I SAM-dependent methyltransferase n=1 Tax=unclassified Streptomyces TaxID=2593676 RepID=UPI0034E23D1F